MKKVKTRNAIVAALLLSAGAMVTWVGRSDAETKMIQGQECHRAIYEAVSIIGVGTFDDPWRPALADDVSGMSAWQSPVNGKWYVRNRNGETTEGPFNNEEDAIQAAIKANTHEWSMDLERGAVVVWAPKTRQDVLKAKHPRMDE